VVNAILIRRFEDNSLCKVKTDKADSLKIANYTLTFWNELKDYSVEDENRQMLKVQSRLYERTQKGSIALRNGLISLTDQVFPGANEFFSTSFRESDGYIKWVDFVRHFWHKDCVARLSLNAFTEKYHKWCSREGYRFIAADAVKIHNAALEATATFPKSDSTKILIRQAADSLNAVYDMLYILKVEMLRLASLLP